MSIPRPWLRGLLHCLLLPTCILVTSPVGVPAATGGWVNEYPRALDQIESEKRNHVFYVGEPIRFAVTGHFSDRYEVRDYWGEVVDHGKAGAVISPEVKQAGWYKLYLYGPAALPASAAVPVNLPPMQKKELTLRQELGDSTGATTFVIFRDDPHFPKAVKDTKDSPQTSYPAMDEVIRGVTGMGPQRLFVKIPPEPADKARLPEWNAAVEKEIHRLEGDVALDKQYYLPFDPARHRALMVAFPDGTLDRLNGVARIVGHFRNDVKYWEPRNEPNGGSSGRDFVEREMKPFYETVKKVAPDLKVLGPGTVSIGPQLLPWIEDFLKAGGGKFIDGFSFHAYNNLNGDPFLARRSMDTLQSLLTRYGLGGIEKWQTEQGYFCAMYGVYAPRHQGRWTMLQMMVFEQYGIPKEHNHVWYDRSHGFWDFPTFWENEDGGLNPAAPLMRVWAEELFGKHFAKAYDFGATGNKLYLGSLFTGAKDEETIRRRDESSGSVGSVGSVAVFMSAGSTDGTVRLKLNGADRIRTVSAFGVESDLIAPGGEVVLPVGELPVYVQIPTGQSLDVVPQDLGPNLALAPGVTAAASGTGKHPVKHSIPNDITKIINGEFENWYWEQQDAAQPWMDDTLNMPAWVEIRFPQPTSVGRVIVYAGTPWQWMGSLLDYELQFERDGQWVTIEHVKEPVKSFRFFTPIARTRVDTFYSDRWIFRHEFVPVKTSKLRLLVHECTYGGGANKLTSDAGGQAGPHQVMLREVEVYP